MATKLAGRNNAEASTFHSIGMRAWGKFVGQRIKVDSYKVMNLIKDQRGIAEEYWNFISKLVSLAKQQGLSPDSNDHRSSTDQRSVIESFMDLVDKHDLASDLQKGFNAEQGIKYAVEILALNNRNRTVIDFDDMIYFPVFFEIEMPNRFEWVLVDEAQDTNPTRRKMAGMLNKGRMVFVGDRHQAIYGFTGADADSVDQIIRDYNCTELPLTVTYRCPKAVVQAAQAYVNHITAHDSAPQGEVVSVPREQFDNEGCKALKPGDAVLCRKNAPLVSLAYKLIRHGIPAQIEGKSDIGKQIIQFTKKWKRVRSISDFLDKMDDWASSQIQKHKDEKGNIKKGKEILVDNIRDRCDTMRLLCDGCNDMQCVRDKVEKMFGDTNETTQKNRVVLSSVHKFKGRETKRVYIYGFSEYMPSKMAKQDWQIEQEKNLCYVALTRSQETLVLIG